MQLWRKINFLDPRFTPKVFKHAYKIKKLTSEPKLVRLRVRVVRRLELVVSRLRVLRLVPLAHVRIDRVTQSIVRIVLEADAARRIPLRVLLRKALK